MLWSRQGAQRFLDAAKKVPDLPPDHVAKHLLQHQQEYGPVAAFVAEPALFKQNKERFPSEIRNYSEHMRTILADRRFQSSSKSAKKKEPPNAVSDLEHLAKEFFSLPTARDRRPNKYSLSKRIWKLLQRMEKIFSKLRTSDSSSKDFDLGALCRVANFERDRCQKLRFFFAISDPKAGRISRAKNCIRAPP